MKFQALGRRTFAARIFLALSAAALSLPAIASDKDDERLAAYRLDRATMVRFEAALDNIAEAIRKNPSIIKGSDNRSDTTIAEMAAFYNGKPPLRDAIAKAGMTPDSFSVFFMSWVQAAMAHGFTQSLPPAQRARAIADSGAPRANVDFVAENKAYLASVGAKLKAITPK
jgi:hypothetical protein